MNTLKSFIYGLLISLCLVSCGIYSFSGISIGPNIKTFEVRPFTNESQEVIPGIDRQFTTTLQDFILNQTNLDLTTKNGDLIYEGEIIDYYIAPNTSTANNIAAQNRLTIGIRLRYTDTKNTDNDIEQSFSFFFDFDGNQLLTGDTATSAYETIFERITQDIVNATLAKW